MVCDIANLEVGMVLLEEICVGGRVLLHKGAGITDRHINILKNWGVTEILVEGEENAVSEEEPDWISEKLNTRFTYCTSRFTAELRSVISRSMKRRETSSRTGERVGQ